MLIYRAIKYYKELWRVENRARSGCLKSVRAEAAIKTVRERINRNPFWKQNSCTERWTYGPNQVVPYQGRSTHESAPPLKRTHLYSCCEGNPTDKSKASLQWQAENGHENTLFTDEKIFTIEEQYNNQYNKIYPQTSITLPTSLFGERRPIWRWRLFIFARKEWKLVPGCIQRMCYKEMWNLLTRLSSMVISGPSSRNQLCPQDQDDSGAAAGNVPAFISAEDWPSGSPDLSPLDYKLWAALEVMACRKQHNNLDSLKRSLAQAAAQIPLETVRAAITERPERLKACVGTEGGHFEWNYYK
jgi:hypothetical protein